MKFIDKYKLSLHNISNNKSRSVLTTIIVYIISLLMTFILTIAISFSSNINKIIEKYYQESGEEVSVNYNYYESDENSQNTQKLNKDNINRIIETAKRNEKVISYSGFATNASSQDEMFVQSHDYPINDRIEIIEGSNVNETHSNTNKALVSAEYALEYYNQYNKKLNVGDTFDTKIGFYSEFPFETTITLEVVGIYKIIENEEDEYSYIMSNGLNGFVMDIEYLLSINPNIFIQSFSYYYDVTNTNFNRDELTDLLKTFKTEIEEAAFCKDLKYNMIYCNALSDLTSSKIISIVFIALALFLSLILILLSIGSLANTIMISVDKNKKFIGLLKALGLNEKDLKGVIKMESITTIVLGVILSFLTLYAFKGVITSLNDLLINSMFSSYINAVDYQIVFSMPIYIPVIVVTFFITFTLLFARGSMTKIAKTDPMAVISEVA